MTEKEYVDNRLTLQRALDEANTALTEERLRVQEESRSRLLPLNAAVTSAFVANLSQPKAVVIVEDRSTFGPGFHAYIPGGREWYDNRAWLRIASPDRNNEWQWSLRLDGRRGEGDILLGGVSSRAALRDQYPQIREQAIAIMRGDGWDILDDTNNP